MSALEIAREAVEKYNRSNAGKGGIAHVARLIGYERPSLSLYLSGRYTASVHKIETAILRKLVGRVRCPYLNDTIAAADCGDYRSRPMPTSDKRAFRHWSVCRTCVHNRMEGPSC